MQWRVWVEVYYKFQVFWDRFHLLRSRRRFSFLKLAGLCKIASLKFQILSHILHPLAFRMKGQWRRMQLEWGSCATRMKWQQWHWCCPGVCGSLGAWRCGVRRRRMDDGSFVSARAPRRRTMMWVPSRSLKLSKKPCRLLKRCRLASSVSKDLKFVVFPTLQPWTPSLAQVAKWAAFVARIKS